MQSKMGVIVGIVAVVLAIVAIIGPWWMVTGQASVIGFTATVDAHFGLFGGTATVTGPTTSTTNTTDYKDSPQVGSVFSVATALTILGVLLGIGMVVVAAMSGMKPSTRRLGAVLGILAFLLVFLAPLYVMSALPNAVNQDSGSASSLTTVTGFWGTRSSTFLGASATFTWGADWAWYVVLVAAVVFLVGAIAMLVARKAAPEAVAPMMAPPPVPPPPP